MTWSPSSRLAVLPILFLFAAGMISPAYAQTETATIYGSVTGPSGAMVPNATIRLIDTDRGAPSEVGRGGQSGGLNPLYQIGGPRSIQLALKLQC